MPQTKRKRETPLCVDNNKDVPAESCASQTSVEMTSVVSDRRRRPRVLGLDCEMAGYGPKGKKSTLVRISVVGRFGMPVFDCLVRPAEVITDWRAHITGIDASNFPEGAAVGNVNGRIELPILERDDAVKRVNEILEDAVVVGHDLRHDFALLGRHHHRRVLLRDTAFCTILKDGLTSNSQGLPKLRQLAQEWLEEDLHAPGAIHDSIGDAQTAMLLYRLIAPQWEAETKLKWGDVPDNAMEDVKLGIDNEDNEDEELETREDEDDPCPNLAGVPKDGSKCVPEPPIAGRRRPKKARRKTK